MQDPRDEDWNSLEFIGSLFSLSHHFSVQNLMLNVMVHEFYVYLSLRSFSNDLDL